MKYKSPDSSNVIVLDSDRNIVDEQSVAKSCHLIEANKVRILDQDKCQIGMSELLTRTMLQNSEQVLKIQQ